MDETAGRMGRQTNRQTGKTRNDKFIDGRIMSSFTDLLYCRGWLRLHCGFCSYLCLWM